MVTKIRKRDGSVVPFNSEKITEAIWKAVKAVGGSNRTRTEELSKLILKKLEERYPDPAIPDVEVVQDLVEKILIEERHAKVAKAYILYRKSHEELRDIKGLFDTIEAVDDYISLNDWMVKENSNMGFSLQGLNNYIATKIISNYWVRRVYPEAIRNAHENADIHIHDLGTLGAYCVGWDLRDLLLTGFKGAPGKVVCAPPKHLRTALAQIVNFFYTLQGETAGAQAFSNFDTLLAPFVRYDNLEYKDVKQCMQEFLFGLAVPTRVGFQCMSQDTEILTPEGWKNYSELKVGDTIKTFNVTKKIIEEKPIKRLFKREYNGVMYNLINKQTDQLISPKHRIVYKISKSENYRLSPIEKIKENIFFVPVSKSNKIKSINDFEDIQINNIQKINYKGIIWCPNTDNETVVARRNGKVFITGNTPFTNITMDLEVPQYMKDEPIIIGGKFQRETYKEFKKEMIMINKAFAECMIEGDAEGKIFTFPIPTYNITNDFDWNNPDYEVIWEMTAKFGIPYFSNFINSDMKPEDARSMCCRLRLDQTELRKRGGGLFGANPQTGSIGVVTINMPRLGFTAVSEDDFFNRLERLMEISKESLEIKRKTIERFTILGLYPYSKFYLRNVYNRFGQSWKNHFATIGLLGMNEAIMNFMPGENIITPKGREFSIKILKFMREKLEEFQVETGNIYNLEATPGEGTSHRFAREDKKRYGRILVANERAFRERKAAPYYTNSTQLPVNYTDDLFEALELQDELQTMYTGGTVLHGFIGERINSESAKRLVKKISENYKLPYFTITPTFSICPKHGYIAGDHEYCPKCDKEIGYFEKSKDSEKEMLIITQKNIMSRESLNNSEDIDITNKKLIMEMPKMTQEFEKQEQKDTPNKVNYIN